MFYKKARIFTSDFSFCEGAFEAVDVKFGAVLPEEVPAEAVDLQGATVIPAAVENPNVRAELICDGFHSPVYGPL